MRTISPNLLHLAIATGTTYRMQRRVAVVLSKSSTQVMCQLENNNQIIKLGSLKIRKRAVRDGKILISDQINY